MAAATWFLVVAGLAAFVWRMIDLSNAPFLLDEPQLLAAARAQRATGTWPTYSTLLGTSGIPYGAAAVWFYAIVQAVLGPSPFVAIAAMGTLLSSAQIFFCGALTRALRRHPEEAGWRSVLSPDGRLILGCLLLLVASSPHQHYWSRLAWDPLANAVAFAVIGILLNLRSGRWVGTVTTGALLGYGLTSHPMLIPFAAVIGTAIVMRDRPRSWRIVVTRALALTVPAVVVMLPWLLSLGTAPRYEGVTEGGTGLTLEWMLEPFRAAGTAGIEHFFDGDWVEFASMNALPGLDLLLVISPMLWVGLGLAGLVLAVRRGRPRIRLLALCGIANLLLYPIFYAVLGAQVQPHYQFPTGWIAVAGVGILLATSSPRVRTATVALTLALAVGQLLFIASWRDWIDDRGGTRGVHYAIPLGEQVEAIEDICEDNTGPMVVALDVVAFPVSFDYLSSITPNCATADVRWCTVHSDCARPRPGEVAMRIQYADPAGARLEVVPDRGMPSS